MTPPMNKTPTPEQLQDALRCIPLAIDNNKYIGCTGQHHKNFLKEFEQTIQFALRFTANALAWPPICSETGQQCKIQTGNNYTHSTGVCVDCGQKPIAGTIAKETRNDT